MKRYQNFKEIDSDLKLLSLERQIALEELKIVKNDFEENLRPIGVLSSGLRLVRKYGVLILIKKFFK
ncbi:MAG: hypothetical protein ACJA17_000499 [Polaribacter sp.]|jgi:hypothetical protein